MHTITSVALLSLLGAALYYHPFITITLIGVIITLMSVTIGRRT